MSDEHVFRCLHEVGCCYGCCARFIGLRNPASYANIDTLALKYIGDTQKGTEKTESKSEDVTSNGHRNGGTANDDGEPIAKRARREACVCCVGVLERHLWSEAIELVKASLKEKNYDCDSFACGLSSPICIALREKSLLFYLEEKIEGHKPLQNITPLKEAWKWMFGPVLAASIDKTVDSGATCPLLISITIDYENDMEEIDRICPSGRSQSRLAERSRRTVQEALSTMSRESLGAKCAVPPSTAGLSRCVSVRCEHNPIYIAGRYVKLSRELSQTPWVIDGKKMMESSVQDVIFEPIAKYYCLAPAQAEQRLKLVAAGREDVDVRCLGTGRPFVVEVTDPVRTPTAADLAAMCADISQSKTVQVKALRLCSREALNELKKGEEFKEKSYRALCIKLPENIEEEKKDNPTVFTEEDLHKLKTYSDGDKSCRFKIQQKTPLRVLHRRSLLTRQRKILHMDAEKVPGHPNLFLLSVDTEAGTYVKELVHGDLGRTRPCLRDVLGARVDILALDVAEVRLEW